MQITLLTSVFSVGCALRKDKTRTNVGSTWIQCGVYLWCFLLSVMQVRIQSYESSSEVVMQKVQLSKREPLQKNNFSFEALYVQPTLLNVTFN